MAISLKKINEQVVVITGATSGIGLTTAREAARRGAKLVLVARNGDALEQLASELKAQGAEVLPVVADVGDLEQIRNVAARAIEQFGHFDTWINNAGVSIFGRYDQVPLEDHRKLFDTNFWGVVNGSLVAVECLKRHGGALINLGSEVSDCAIPLQGMYSASKHAIKGFTDSLRMELEHDEAPVSVTLIKPAGIDTMFVRHAKNYMDVEPRLPPPIYAPQVVAEAILYAAEHPKRDIYVGGAARMAASTAHYAPRMLDKVMKGIMYNQQRTNQPRIAGRDNSLYTFSEDMHEQEGHDTHVFKRSLYTKAVTNPKSAQLAMVGAGLALAALWQARRTR
jgi:short-subunit dehydrogenase